jgi:alkylation response protein AidB-like acyl-CoA dehydrogenase
VSSRSGAPVANSADYVAEARRWQALKAAAGYSCITLPKPWGPGGTPIERAIFTEEEAALGVAYGSLMTIGAGMAIPTIVELGDESMKDRLVPETVRGERFWCQLFSEPAGGSDAAAARTRAVRKDGRWVVNGQKIWTSVAKQADNGLLLARTDPDAPKHKGLTMFIVDMHDPAIEVRPIHQMSDGYEFNEVFFNDLVLSDADVLGGVGQGWQAAIVTLMNERFTVGAASGAQYAELVDLAREVDGPTGPAIADPSVRAKIADMYISFEGLRLTRLRALTALSRGRVPGPENSIGKLIAAQQGQDLANFAVELEDQFGVISDPRVARMNAVFQEQVLSSPGVRIAGGTDEILRNIIAERVLGLPGDVRVDKDVAFKDLPTGR